MYNRQLAPILTQNLKNYPVITLIGARQTGKTTLVRTCFPEFDYTSLEDLDIRNRALEDPRGFLNGLGLNCILDEVQRVPELTSYIQTIVDLPENKRKFVLTGSNGLLLIDSISQTLAGRTEINELHSLSFKELSDNQVDFKLNELMYGGGYPRIHDKNLSPTQWYKNYFKLYVEKDIRLIANIKKIDQFEKFIRLMAGRCGQLSNANSLSSEAGVSTPTINEWIAALKTTYICFSLPAHFKNFSKRIVKTPKLYFFDTGLLCYLLGIAEPGQLEIHPLRGQIFENFIISECFKNKANLNKEASFYFWRDQKGHEIDLLEDRSTHLVPNEIKLAETFHSSFLKNIQYFNKLQNLPEEHQFEKGSLLYRGEDGSEFKGIRLSNWKEYLLGPHF